MRHFSDVIILLRALVSWPENTANIKPQRHHLMPREMTWNELRYCILMMYRYPDLASASDWSCRHEGTQIA